MDPEVVSDVPDRCRKCGMKLLRIAMVSAALELSTGMATSEHAASGMMFSFNGKRADAA